MHSYSLRPCGTIRVKINHPKWGEGIKIQFPLDEILLSDSLGVWGIIRADTLVGLQGGLRNLKALKVSWKFFLMYRAMLGLPDTLFDEINIILVNIDNTKNVKYS